MIAVLENCYQSAPSTSVLSAVRIVAPRRFTLDGDEALERHLELTCDRVLSGVRGLIPARKFEALLLGGGYGRGEGGVFRGPDGDRPYNDLEFYVAIAGERHFNEFLYGRRLHVLGKILTHLAGVEVEFKITSLAELARRPISMFSFDLVVGHRLVWSASGARTLDGCAHHRRAETIPLGEATRLLMNRCTGLLLARRRLAEESFTASAADFVCRNIAKAQLALGDALLTAHGLYHESCLERHRRLRALASAEPGSWFPVLVRHHAAGVVFKLHPTSAAASRESLAELHREVTAFAFPCWLWLEARRLPRPFVSARTYALDAADKCPGGSRLLNIVLNLRAVGIRAALQRAPWRHPRQRIFRALALLLWEPAALSDPQLRSRIERELGTRFATFDQAVDAYESLWSRVR